MHAADVLQLIHLFLIKGNIMKIAKLTNLDKASILFAAICHDFKHPGLTNGFLINTFD